MLHKNEHKFQGLWNRPPAVLGQGHFILPHEQNYQNYRAKFLS